MAAVYEAVDARLQNTVAVKQMITEGPGSDRAFEQEARLLAGLRHPALPVVIDYFVDTGGHFLVMQFIEGDDLSRTLDRTGGPCEPGDVLAWARAVLDALAFLHQHQPPIVHRDIKPSNLKRTPTGDIVLLDFGLAKGHARPQPNPAGDRSLYGYTLHYAPLEQLEWRPTDARSDLYALGATLFHLLTGVLPPAALQRAAAMRDGHVDPLCPPSVLSPRVDEAFSRVVVRAMALAPADRYGSATEMRAALPGGEASVPDRARRQPRGRVRAKRRVDAAMPSEAEQDRQVDLLVQVRFPQSPLLGLDDWPTRRKPARIEQAAGDIMVFHPADPRTGETVPARLRVHVIAPDFTIAGQTALVVDVPSNDYSARLAFLLTPRRLGMCRVNVEVHGSDDVFLGAIPIETDVVGGSVTHRGRRVSTVALGAIAQQVVEALRRSEQAAGTLDGAPDSAVVLAVGEPTPTVTVVPPSAAHATEGWDAAMLTGPSAGTPDVTLGGPTQHDRPAGSWLTRGAALASLAGVAVVAASMLLRNGPPENQPADLVSQPPPRAEAVAPLPAPAAVVPREAAGAAGGSIAAITKGGSRPQAAQPVPEPYTEVEKVVQDQARRDIEKTVIGFQTALGRLDFEAIQRIFPDAPLEVRDRLRQAETFAYTYTGDVVITQLYVAAGRAVVEVDARQVWKARSGEQQDTLSHVTFHLFKRQDEWLIRQWIVSPIAP